MSLPYLTIYVIGFIIAISVSLLLYVRSYYKRYDAYILNEYANPPRYIEREDEKYLIARGWTCIFWPITLIIFILWGIGRLLNPFRIAQWMVIKKRKVLILTHPSPSVRSRTKK